MSDTTPVLADVLVEFEDSEYFTGWNVAPIWANVDRPNVGGWGLRDEKLARRLERAIRAGAAFTDTTVKVDVDGNTYVCATHAVMAKYANADLKRLGF